MASGGGDHGVCALFGDLAEGQAVASAPVEQAQDVGAGMRLLHAPRVAASAGCGQVGFTRQFRIDGILIGKPDAGNPHVPFEEGGLPQ